MVVVEDHDDSRELALQIVESAGASVVAVASVDEALDVLARKRISVVVADIGLPEDEIGGPSLVRQIRAHRLQRLRTIPVIAVTAYVSASDRERTLAMGFHQHVAKPADPVTLIDAIARAVASRPARTSASPPTVPLFARLQRLSSCSRFSASPRDPYPSE